MLNVLIIVSAAILLAGPVDRWLEDGFPVLRDYWSLRLIVLFLIVTAAHTCVSFPLSFYSGHVLEHRFGLSTQTFAAWLWRYAKRNALAVGLGLVLVLGLYWLIKGIFHIVGIFVDSSRWGWKLFVGILGIVAGIVILQHPMLSAVLIPSLTVIFVGLLGITIGVINLIQAFQGSGWGVGILGVLSILFGIFLAFNPLAGAVALAIVLGVLGVIGGVAAIIFAFKMR